MLVICGDLLYNKRAERQEETVTERNDPGEQTYVRDQILYYHGDAANPNQIVTYKHAQPGGGGMHVVKTAGGKIIVAGTGDISVKPRPKPPPDS